MRIFFKVAPYVILLFLMNSSFYAQERNFSIQTNAGSLSVSSTPDSLDCFIKLGKKTIRKFECDYSPQVLKDIKQLIPPFDEIVVFQEQTTAQVCDGLDVFFLGLNKNGTYDFSEPIDYCGGPKPLVRVNNKNVIVTFPAFKAARGGFIRKQIWVYEKGTIHQIK